MDLMQYGQPTDNFIVQASFDGRLKSNEGFLSAVGDLCTLTAGAGKDLYVTAAKCVFFINTINQTPIPVDEVVLKINGTVVETVKSSIILLSAAGSSGSSVFAYDFKNLFHKVSATQIIKLEVISISSPVDVEGFVQAVEVPSGSNPLTYRGA